MTRLLLQLRILIGLGGLFVGLATSAAATRGAGDRVDVIGVRLTDTAGRQHRIGESEGTPQPAVLVFLDTACPVATRMGDRGRDERTVDRLRSRCAARS